MIVSGVERTMCKDVLLDLADDDAANGELARDCTLDNFAAVENDDIGFVCKRFDPLLL